MPPQRFSMPLVDAGILLFLGAVWGAAFLFFRVASPEVGPAWAAVARVGIAALILGAMAGVRINRSLRGRWPQIAVVGATMSAIPFTLVAVATTTLPAGLSALLNATTPLFTTVVAALWIGERVSTRAVAGLGFGLVAVPVAVGLSPLDPGPSTILAALASLGAALSYAVGGTFVRRSLRDVAPLDLATGQLIAATLLLMPVAALTGMPPVPSPSATVALVGIGTVSTALAWPLFFRVIGRTSAMAASTVTFIVPVFGILWGAIVLGEAVGPGLVGGFGLVVVSLVLVLRIPIPLPAPVRRFVDRRLRPAASTN